MKGWNKTKLALAYQEARDGNAAKKIMNAWFLNIVSLAPLKIEGGGEG